MASMFQKIKAGENCFTQAPNIKSTSETFTSNKNETPLSRSRRQVHLKVEYIHISFHYLRQTRSKFYPANNKPFKAVEKYH